MFAVCRIQEPVYVVTDQRQGSSEQTVSIRYLYRPPLPPPTRVLNHTSTAMFRSSRPVSCTWRTSSSSSHPSSTK